MKKAMLLAAGFGTRLRPLTNDTPKPMLKVQGRPLIDYPLMQLAEAGIHEVMINLHYLPNAIKSHVGDGSAFGLRVQYSFEPEILGTAGGVKNCEDFFNGEAFLIMNADVLTDLQLHLVIEAHNTNTENVATLVVRQLAAGEAYTAMTVRNDAIAQIGAGEFHYTGIMVGSSALVEALPTNGPSNLVIDGVEPLIQAGHAVGSHIHTGYWNDVGTPARYQAACGDHAVILRNSRRKRGG
jgi:NDP-sugar pyrophosphorylase family protein